MNDQLPCHCGSGNPYHSCCSPYHADDQIPVSAEALMRSRFSAYAAGLSDYIQQTWDVTTRPKPEKTDFAKENINWQKLEILETKKGGQNDSKGLVEFKAYYQLNGLPYLLHETSRFVKHKERWFYLDGVVKRAGQLVEQTNLGKNAPCSCGSGKKFKRCCGVE